MTAKLLLFQIIFLLFTFVNSNVLSLRKHRFDSSQSKQIKHLRQQLDSGSTKIYDYDGYILVFDLKNNYF